MTKKPVLKPKKNKYLPFFLILSDLKHHLLTQYRMEKDLFSNANVKFLAFRYY